MEYRPDLGDAGDQLPARAALDDADFADPGVLARAADACRRLHAGPRFVGDFDMFARQAGYLATVRERGFPLPPAYDDHADAWERRTTGAGGRRRGRRCRATTTCWPANYIDDGERVWLIDYEYCGNNDACFELGNTSTECELHRRADRGLDARRTSATPTRADLARVRLQALCSQYGWSLWGFIQAAASPIDYDFHGWGMERFEKAEATFRGPGPAARLLEEVAGG